MWLYRGDIKAEQSTSTSYQLFRHFKEYIPLICFSDLDPKGIEIALTSHADYWLTLQNSNEVDMPLLGSDQEWYKQGASISFLHNQSNYKEIITRKGACWKNIFETLLTYRITLKQEQILKHKLSLSLIDNQLKPTDSDNRL